VGTKSKGKGKVSRLYPPNEGSLAGCGTKSKVSHAADNVARKIKKHVSEKGVWRMCDQGPHGREGTPLMVSGAFTVALSWIYIKMMFPTIQVPLPEVLNKNNDQDQWFHTSAAFP